jgi:hypothetical protein
MTKSLVNQLLGLSSINEISEASDREVLQRFLDSKATVGEATRACQKINRNIKEKNKKVLVS